MDKNEKKILMEQMDIRAKELQEHINYLSDIRNNMSDTIDGMVKEKIKLQSESLNILKELAGHQ